MPEDIQDAEYEVQEEQEAQPQGTALAPYQSPDPIVATPHVDLKLDITPATLANFIIEIPIGGRTVQTLSADGYKHILQVMGLQVRYSKVVTDPEDPEMWEGEAMVYNPFTGASYIGGSDEPKKFRNGRVNVNAKQSCRTKAIRNGIKGLIPAQELRDAAIAWKSGEVENTPLHQAQKRLKAAGEYYIKHHERKIGLPSAEVKAAAVERYGDYSDWQISDFDELSEALRNPYNSWINDLIKEQ